MLSPEHLEARRGKVTSTRASAILGLNPYKSELGAFAEILELEEEKRTEALKRANNRGHLLEPVALQTVCDDLGLQRQPAPFRSGQIGDWAGDSMDCVFSRMRGGHREIVAGGEAKTATGRFADEYGDTETDSIPEGHLIQCHWHLLHWPELDVVHVPVILGGWDVFEFRRYTVKRDDELEGHLREECERWHRDHIVARKPPPPSSSEKDRRVLQLLRPKATKGMLADTPQIKHWAAIKDDCRDRRKILESNEREAENNLRVLLGDHEGVRASWGSVLCREAQFKPATDWKALAKSFQRIGRQRLAKFTTTPPPRRDLKVHIRKEKGSK